MLQRIRLSLVILITAGAVAIAWNGVDDLRQGYDNWNGAWNSWRAHPNGGAPSSLFSGMQIAPDLNFAWQPFVETIAKREAALGAVAAIVLILLPRRRAV